RSTLRRGPGLPRRCSQARERPERTTPTPTGSTAPPTELGPEQSGPAGWPAGRLSHGSGTPPPTDGEPGSQQRPGPAPAPRRPGSGLSQPTSVLAGGMTRPAGRTWSPAEQQSLSDVVRQRTGRPGRAPELPTGPPFRARLKPSHDPRTRPRPS